jgi:FkbM family methyltransferase
MLLDVASTETPRLTRPDGTALPRLLTGPPAATRYWRRGVGRLHTGRLPAMLATFADGRRFHIEAGDVMYEQIYRLGEYEPTVSAAIRGLLRPGDFAIDVGANHGWFTVLLAAATRPCGVVWAVEPGAEMVAALRRNAALNTVSPAQGGSDVEVYDVALGEGRGEVDLHVFAGLPHGHASTRPLGRQDHTAQRVSCRTLDDLLHGAGEMPALVKLDVEGSELNVLRGATTVLAARRSMWLVEVNTQTSAAFGYDPMALTEPFGDGYAVYRLGPTGFEPERAPAAVPHGTMWLFVPATLRDRVDAFPRS